jgi:hypothetical protein
VLPVFDSATHVYQSAVSTFFFDSFPYTLEFDVVSSIPAQLAASNDNTAPVALVPQVEQLYFSAQGGSAYFAIAADNNNSQVAIYWGLAQYPSASDDTASGTGVFINGVSVANSTQLNSNGIVITTTSSGQLVFEVRAWASAFVTYAVRADAFSSCPYDIDGVDQPNVPETESLTNIVRAPLQLGETVTASSCTWTDADIWPLNWTGGPAKLHIELNPMPGPWNIAAGGQQPQLYYAIYDVRK